MRTYFGRPSLPVIRGFLLRAVILVLEGVIFGVDSRLPSPYALDVLYIVPLRLTFFLLDLRWTLGIILLSFVLDAVDFFFISEITGDPTVAVTNIGVSLLAQIVIGLISLRFVRLARDEAVARHHSE